LAKNGRMRLYAGSGENIYWSPAKPTTGSIPANAWYSELKNYDFKNPGAQKKTAHFTQLIWKRTEFIGIAMESGKKGYYVVVNYFPPGNLIEKFADNVLKIPEPVQVPLSVPAIFIQDDDQSMKKAIQ